MKEDERKARLFSSTGLVNPIFARLGVTVANLRRKENNMKRKNQKSGQGLVEYVLLVALLALVSVMALTATGQTVGEGLLGNIQTNISAAEQKINTAP